MIERQIDIETRDGPCGAFVVHPDRGGPHPVIVLLMDAPGIREELRDMARRYATSGYYVMLPNLYHREGVAELGPGVLTGDAAARARMVELMNGLGITPVMGDLDAMLAFAADDGAADADRVGVVGYCMSGRFALCAGAHRPGQVKAVASFYGVRLLTDKSNSPHLIARAAPAEFYIGCAETDPWVPVEMIARLKAEMAGAHGEVELYPGVEHGFAFPQRAVYDKAAAEQHWQRVLALFRRALG